MKFQVLTLFLVLSVCHGESEIVVNNVTEVIPPITEDIAPTPASSTIKPTSKPGPDPTPAPITIPTTAVSPNDTTPSTTAASSNITTSTTPSTPTSKPTTPTPITKPTSTSPTSPTTPSHPTTQKTTVKPTPTALPVTTGAPPSNNRKFDGPSFVGGIVLASGLMAIGFVAFKFYRARTELNYHTL